jgi:hypothetical protein
MTGHAILPFDLSNAVLIDFETYGGGTRSNRPVLVIALDDRRLAGRAACTCSQRPNCRDR